MDLAIGVEQVVLHQRVGEINRPKPIDGEAINVDVRLKRLGSEGPNATLASFHGPAVDAFTADLDFAGVRGSKAEGYAAVGMNLR